MSIVTERILREAMTDWVTTIRIENVVTDYGMPEPESMRRTAEAAVRELVESGLVVLGDPVSGPQRFQVWSDDPSVALQKLTQEWDSGRLERPESFAWLGLTPAGEREAERLMAERRHCERRVLEELCKRHPEVLEGLGLSDVSQRLTMASLAAEVAAGQAPSWRAGLSGDVLRAVVASIDELYDHGEPCCRELILDEVVRMYANHYPTEGNELLAARLGPCLREVITQYDDAYNDALRKSQDPRSGG